MSLITNARTLVDQNRNGTLGPITALKFPDDIEAVPHKMVITIRSRAFNARTRSDGGIQANRVTGSNIRGAVVLPVPSNIIENYSADYSRADLGVIGNAIATASDSLISGLGNVTSPFIDSTNIAGSLESIYRAAADSVGPVRNALSTGLNAVTGGNVANLGGAAAYQAAINATTVVTRDFFGIQNVPAAAAIAAGTGMIFNPHQTAVFTGVNIRSIQYDWVLAPKKEKESKAVEQIVQTLRNAMLPKRSTNNLFLNFPDEIEYKILGPTNDYSMPTVPCVITNISLNRTGAGQPSFFAKTGAPTVYRLTIGLMEIRALLRDDFENTQSPSQTPNNPTVRGVRQDSRPPNPPATYVGD